jgi:LuxR family transcriptional regulator, quorum-sensing system regulator SdiA
MMAKETAKVDAMRGVLTEIGSICDTGFALAIHIRFTRPALLYRTYRSDWIEYYSEKGFMLSDPVVHWGLMNSGKVLWDDLSEQDSAGVLTDAKGFGLTNGWTYSVGPAASRTISGHTKSGADFTTDQVATLQRLVQQAHDLTEGIDTFGPESMDALRLL